MAMDGSIGVRWDHETKGFSNATSFNRNTKSPGASGTAKTTLCLGGGWKWDPAEAARVAAEERRREAEELIASERKALEARTPKADKAPPASPAGMAGLSVRPAAPTPKKAPSPRRARSPSWAVPKRRDRLAERASGPGTKVGIYSDGGWLSEKARSNQMENPDQPRPEKPAPAAGPHEILGTKR